ncbi:WD40-repeat-containing domain protein [Coemansia spiralis]|nr:WD40-repeat-containing domain protein [Coemansia spiralis]KAJ1991650.1 hypothetical protein EDC05_003275 [Coemansia umbellata]
MADYSAETLSILRADPLKAVLTSKTLSEFHIVKKFSDNKAPITSLDYDSTGALAITTSTDESLRIYDCVRGVRGQVLYSKKYGCSLAQFARPGCVAYASTKINDTIRYLSCETNQFIRYFVGHSLMVTSLQRSPEGSTTMVSAALDGTVRLWDWETVNPVATVRPSVPPGRLRGIEDSGIVAAFDPSGAVVAVAVASSELQLFDVREMSRGPFKTSTLPSVSSLGGPLVAGMHFVPPVGDYILLAMTDGTSHIVDAFSLDHHATLVPTMHDNLSSSTHSFSIDGSNANGNSAISQMQKAFLGQRLTITPDGKTAIAGGDNGSVIYWDISQMGGLDAQTPFQLSPVGVWSGSHNDGSIASASSTAAVKTDTPAAAGTITKDSAEYQASVDKFYARLTEAKTSKQILVAKIELIEELDFDLYNEGPFMADANKRLKEITALKAKNAD